jgi:hypothetical protein
MRGGGKRRRKDREILVLAVDGIINGRKCT